MYRLLALALATCAGRAAAQEPDAPAIPATKLTVRAAAAPVPALRYRLLPEQRDLTPGNAVQLYYRAFAPEWIGAVRTNRKLMDKIDAATGKPPAEVKAVAELAFLRKWKVLAEVDRAARRAYCDWELTPRLREDGIGLLLPDVQTMREFARYLAVRTRLELADGDFDAAVRSLQTGLAMGRHVGDGPVLIQALVGVAIDAVTLDSAEELIRTPGSPNLYWALAALPRPFVDMRTAYEGEHVFVDQLFPGYRDALRAKAMAPLPPGAFDRIRRDIVGLADSGSAASFALAAVKKYAPAKKYLTDRGWDAKAVEALPALQVVLLGEVAELDRWYDEAAKWLYFPYPVARKGIDDAERRLQAKLASQGMPGASLAGLLLPSTAKVQFAARRVERQIAALMAIEALRLHAARASSLPDRLADATDVPVPLDPVTGQPFAYERHGDAATLTLPPPVGDAPNERNSRRYEITLAK